MNIALMPENMNLEFYFHPVEIHKSDEDIKSCYYNVEGVIIAIVTKSNLLKIFDFLGKKSVLFTITYFKETDKISKILINKFTV